MSVSETKNYLRLVVCLARTITPVSFTLFPLMSILVKKLMLNARILQDSSVMLLFLSYIPATFSFFSIYMLSTSSLSLILLLLRRISLVLESNSTFPILKLRESRPNLSYLLSFRILIFWGEESLFCSFSSRGPRKLCISLALLL